MSSITSWIATEWGELKRWAFAEQSAREKLALRQTFREQRREQDPRIARYKSRRIAECLLVLPEMQNAQTVAAYMPVHGEVDTLPIIEWLLQSNKAVVLPTVLEQEIRFLQITNLENNLRQGAYGIQEPNPEHGAPVQPEAIDLFLVPGVGFDLFQGRIGFGGGYYDRILKEKSPNAATIGLAYDFQVQHALPSDEHDQPIQQVISEEHVYRPRLSDWRTESEAQTGALAQQMVHAGLRQGGVIALHGELGTGKTVFVNGLAQALEAVEQPISPTFVYCRKYHGVITLYHIDGYRIERITPQDQEFWGELLEQPGLIAVEWAERLGPLLPKSAVHLFGSVGQGNRRRWRLLTPLRQQAGLHKLSLL